jgi:hypothetical protein
MNCKRYRIEYYYADSHKQLSATEITLTKPMTEPQFRKYLKKELETRKPSMFRVTTRGFFYD